MNTSNNFQFNLPQSTDTVDISKISDNFDKLDTELQSIKTRGENNELFIGSKALLKTDATDTLVAAINEVNAHADTNEESISAEITRATKAESTLTTNLSAEVTRAQKAESTLTTDLGSEVSRAKEAESANATAISTEKSRAEGAESTLTSNLNAEITRAKNAESTNATAISDEVTRAKAAEKENADAIASLKTQSSTHGTNVTNLTKRVAANESAISTLNGTGDGSVSKQVSDGIAKIVANAPEDFDTLKEISDWISTHKSDASAMNTAITENATNISAEITRATKAESDLTTNLNAEIERAKAAEKANADAIANIDTSGGGVGSEAKCAYVTPRWLRFDPSNRKGLIIKAGTHIKNSNGDYVDFTEDTHIDMSSYITQNGADYYVYMSDDGAISAYTEYQSTGVKIGRFHTLCVDVGTIDMIAPYSPSSATVGMEYLIKSYRKENDPDFYAFYNKSVTAVTAQTYYDICTMAHPLSGYAAKDILPESIFCLSWDTETLYEDAMVYDRDTNTVADIYLQSGTGLNTKSVYNATHTVSRQAFNHMEDMRQVGKKLLGDAQFSSFAIGSNEATNISGSSDKTTVGGHVDTNSRRMISAVGCEEMCGYLWQWLDELVYRTDSSYSSTDGHGSFGQEYYILYVLLAGGHWNYGSYCGSRCRNSDASRSDAYTFIGGRGSSQVRTICV